MNTKLTERWKKVELSDVTDCLDVKRIPLNSEERSKMKGNIPYYGANGQVDSINKYIFDEELLLLAEDGGSWGARQNCAYIINGKSWVNNHAHVLKMKKEINISYLMYFLNYHDLNRFISGTTRGKLNQSVMKKIPLILPPLPVQKKIVLNLKKIEKAKELRKKTSELTKDFLKSVFIDMFGNIGTNHKKWDQITLPEIVSHEKNSIKRGPFGSSLKKEIFTKKGFLIYEQYHAINDDFSMARYFIDEKKYEEMEAFRVKPGDLIISCSGVTLGRIAEIPRNALPGIINQALLKITLNPQIANSVYFKYLFRSAEIQRIIFKASRGSGIPNFPSMNEIKSINFPIPPISLQNKFASIAKKIEEMKEYQKQSKDYLENLFNSIMQNVFRGELAC